MGMGEILEQFEDCPVVAAIKDEEGLDKCLTSDIQIVFVLYGDICNIGDIVGRLKAAGKTVFIHADLIGGLGCREVAVTYLRRETDADGIISTKPALIKQAKTVGFFAIMRFFVIDSMAFGNVEKQIENVKPDMIELIPGVMPKVIRKVVKLVGDSMPVIVGGLIMDKEDVMAALNAGAVSISSTCQDVWFL